MELMALKLLVKNAICLVTFLNSHRLLEVINAICVAWKRQKPFAPFLVNMIEYLYLKNKHMHKPKKPLNKSFLFSYQGVTSEYYSLLSFVYCILPFVENLTIQICTPVDGFISSYWRLSQLKCVLPVPISPTQEENASSIKEITLKVAMCFQITFK